MTHIVRWTDRKEDEMTDCGELTADILRADGRITTIHPSSYVPDNAELARNMCQGCVDRQS